MTLFRKVHFIRGNPKSKAAALMLEAHRNSVYNSGSTVCWIDIEGNVYDHPTQIAYPFSTRKRYRISEVMEMISENFSSAVV